MARRTSELAPPSMPYFLQMQPGTTQLFSSAWPHPDSWLSGQYYPRHTQLRYGPRHRFRSGFTHVAAVAGGHFHRPLSLVALIKPTTNEILMTSSKGEHTNSLTGQCSINPHCRLGACIPYSSEAVTVRRPRKAQDPPPPLPPLHTVELGRADLLCAQNTQNTRLPAVHVLSRSTDGDSPSYCPKYEERVSDFDTHLCCCEKGFLLYSDAYYLDYQFR